MRRESGRMKRVRDIVLEYEKDAIKRQSDEEEDLNTRVLRRAVRGALRDLTPRQREFLLMYYRDGMPMREIAARAGVVPSDVSHTIRRAKENLRRVLRLFSPGGEE